MWNILSYFITLITFTAPQLLVLFKCIGINNKRRQIFAVIISYSFIYMTLRFYFAAFADMKLLSATTAIMVVHTLYTFILIAVIAIGNSEFLPRNFLISSFYLDLLSVIPLPHSIVRYYLIQKFESEGIDVTSSAYNVNSIYDTVAYIQWIFYPLAVFIVYLIFNKRLKQLVSRIPDTVCTIVFFSMFVTYISRCIYMMKDSYFSPDLTHQNYPYNNTFYMSQALITLTLVICILFILYTIDRYRIKSIIKLESRLQLDYYTNVTEIYNSVRKLRHDTANHISASRGTDNRYSSSIADICREISRKASGQIKWLQFKTSILSSREKYEIYQLALSIADKAGADRDMITVSASENEVVIDIQNCRLSLFRLFAIKTSGLYSLTKAIAKQHKGSLKLKREEKSRCSVVMNFF